jgi:NADH-quinone oxidoreductase subunit F
LDIRGPGSALIERLLEESDKKGFLAPGSVEAVSRELSIPASRAYSIAGQLEHFRFEPAPKGAVSVCAGPACELAGSDRIVRALEALPGGRPAPLLGSPIWHAPVLAMVPGRQGAMPRRVDEEAALAPGDLQRAPLATTEEPTKELLSGKGELLGGLKRRRSVADYFKSDGKRFKRFIEQNPPEEVLRAVRAARLVDTATGHEMADVIERLALSEEPSRMVVCDTGGREPENDATPVLAWTDPMGVVEGMLLAAHAAGAGRALLFVPHEHAGLKEAFARALRDLESESLWPSVEVGIFSGPNFIPTDRAIGIASLYGGLTLSEAATRARVSRSRLWGADAFMSEPEVFLRLSRTASKPRKAAASRIISVGGRVNKPCVAEAALTATAGEFIAESAGGFPRGSVVKAVHFGGVYGGPLRPVALKSRLRSLFGRLDGAGSGQILVIDRGTCMVRWAEYFSWLGERLCCGACVTGRLGPSYVRRIIKKITSGEGELADLEEIRATIELMKETSLCPQGGRVLNPVLVCLENFSGEFEEHIIDKKCQAGVCWP